MFRPSFDEGGTSVKLALRTIVSLLVVVFFHSAARSQDPIPFVPTPMVVVERMLQLADIKKSDLVYDLGCGDGRILIQAAKKYGTRGVGIDLDPQRVEEARQNAKKEGVSHLLQFRVEDGTQTDISKATVVMLYMFKWFNNAIRPKLQNLKPGSRVVAHDFDIDDWKPTAVVNLEPEKDGPGIDRPHTLYLWKVDPPQL
jgi:SAM-dependent methyltransferase